MGTKNNYPGCKDCAYIVDIWCNHPDITGMDVNKWKYPTFSARADHSTSRCGKLGLLFKPAKKDYYFWKATRGETIYQKD